MSSVAENNLYQGKAWRIASAATVVLVLLVFFLYQQTVFYLTGIWGTQTGDYAHGYLVLMISAYLIFYNRQKLALLTPCPEYKALVIVTIASMVWLVAALVDIAMLKAVALLLLLLSILWLVLGTRVTRILAFPVLFISFAIPVWFPLSPVLQELTADAVFWVIRIMEIPALRIENLITLPAGTLSVDEACGGLNYFLAAMTLSTLYAYLNYETLRSRLVVVLVAAIAALLVNILRVFILVHLAYTTEMQHPLIHDHLAFGWFLFAGLIVVLLVVDVLLQKLPQFQLSPLHSNAVQPVVKVACKEGKPRFIPVMLAAALFIFIGPGTLYWLYNQTSVISVEAQPVLPTTVGEWSVVVPAEDDWMPQYRGAINHKLIFQNDKGQQVYLYIGLYPVQKQGKELINALNRISDDKIWYSGYQRAKLYRINGRQVLEQVLESKDGRQRLVWYWYNVAGQNTVNKYQAKLLQILGLINGTRQAAVVAIAVRFNEEPAYARDILRQFAEAVNPSIERVIVGEN